MPTPMREYAKARLAEARQRAGLSTYEVAEKTGSNQATIWRMENSNVRLDGVILARVCRLYGVSVDYVMGTFDPDVENRPADVAIAGN